MLLFLARIRGSFPDPAGWVTGRERLLRGLVYGIVRRNRTRFGKVRVRGIWRFLLFRFRHMTFNLLDDTSPLRRLPYRKLPRYRLTEQLSDGDFLFYRGPRSKTLKQIAQAL
jgi:hypothetical protein